MQAFNLSEYSSFAPANSHKNPSDDRTCPHCGKEYDDDGRARAAFLRHVADCEQNPQTHLWQWEAEA